MTFIGSLKGDAHPVGADFGFGRGQGLLERAVEFVEQLLLALVAGSGDERVQPDARLHPPGAERPADDLQSGG